MKAANSRQQTADSKKQTANGRQQTADRSILRLSPVHCSLFTVHCSLFAVYLPMERGRIMFSQIDYTMVIVSDMQRSVEFYRDKLGIPLKFQSHEWTEFATGATTLALHGGGVDQAYQDTGAY